MNDRRFHLVCLQRRLRLLVEAMAGCTSADPVERARARGRLERIVPVLAEALTDVELTDPEADRE